MPTKILMVCLGNICRSPLAEGLLHRKATNLDVHIDSAGTSSFHSGDAPDPRMQLTARRRGVELSSLRARQVRLEDFEEFDLIYAMDRSNYDNLLALAAREEHRAKVQLILNEIYPGEDLEVPDPYFGGDHGFEQVFDLLDRATDAIVAKLKEQA